MEPIPKSEVKQPCHCRPKTISILGLTSPISIACLSPVIPKLLITALSSCFLLYIWEPFAWLFVSYLLRSSALGRQSWVVSCLVQSFASICHYTNVNRLCRCTISSISMCALSSSFGLYSMWSAAAVIALGAGDLPVIILTPLSPHRARLKG